MFFSHLRLRCCNYSISWTRKWNIRFAWIKLGVWWLFSWFLICTLLSDDFIHIKHQFGQYITHGMFQIGNMHSGSVCGLVYSKISLIIDFAYCSSFMCLWTEFQTHPPETRFTIISSMYWRHYFDEINKPVLKLMWMCIIIWSTSVDVNKVKYLMHASKSSISESEFNGWYHCWSWKSSQLEWDSMILGVHFVLLQPRRKIDRLQDDVINPSRNW
jgi:hypothetical protein